MGTSVNTVARKGAKHPTDGGRLLGGFTLLELLVVVATIAVLLSLLLPALHRARIQTAVVRAHADLRNIGIALDTYVMYNSDTLPPTRSACGSDVQYQLPVELSDQAYLPPSPSRIPQANFSDVFDPKHTYKYLAPGAIWFNGTFFDFPDSTWRPRAKIWVPDDFPLCESEEGEFYGNLTDEPPSPVTYAIWSVGPDPQASKFPRYEEDNQIDTSRFPLVKRFWLVHSGESGGLITHYKSRKGFMHLSP